MPPAHVPVALHPLFDALDAAEACVRQDQGARAIAHLTCARILLEAFALAQVLNVPEADAAARLTAAMDMVVGEAAEVISLADRRAERERARP